MTTESVNNESAEAPEDDLATRERAFMERTKEKNATSNSWRARQLRRMAGNPNNFYLPKKD